MADLAKLQARYGQSEHANFEVCDTIGVPHSYVIGPKHVAYASDHCAGILNEDAINRAEQAGAKCCHTGCTLKYKQHEQGLVVRSKVKELQGNEELHAYLLKSKPLAEEDGYAGFAFMEWRT